MSLASSMGSSGHDVSPYRLNTTAGSMRMTLKMALTAANTHMPTVSTKQQQRQIGRHDDRQVDGSCESLDHDQAQHDAQDVADDGAQHRLPQDHLADVARGGAERAQGGELVEVVLGAGVERLGDDDDADDDAERRTGDQRRAGAGLEQPVVEAALAELGVGEDLGVGQARLRALCATSSMLLPGATCTSA